MRSLLRSRSAFPVAMFVLALAFAGGALLAGTVGSPSERVSFELRKHLIQFFLVTALGALVGLAVYEYRNRREALARERQFLVDSIAAVLGQLDASYRRVKKSRRLLRLSWSRGRNREAYVEAMLKLDEEQQDLEQLQRELETLQRLAYDIKSIQPEELRDVRTAVRNMERYLGGLWSEHERTAHLSDEEFGRLNIDLITAFLARVKTGEGDFGAFSGGYHDARDTLLGLLAQSRLGLRRGDARTEHRR